MLLLLLLLLLLMLVLLFFQQVSAQQQHVSMCMSMRLEHELRLGKCALEQARAAGAPAFAMAAPSSQEFLPARSLPLLPNLPRRYRHRCCNGSRRQQTRQERHRLLTRRRRHGRCRLIHGIPRPSQWPLRTPRHARVQNRFRVAPRGFRIRSKHSQDDPNWAQSSSS